MTAKTTNYQFRYGDLNDLPDGATQTQTLAQDVDLALKTAKIGVPGGDTPARLSNSALTLSAGSGFSSLDYSWQVRNGWMDLLVEVSRTGASIVAGSAGNIVNTTIATLSSNRPAFQLHTPAYLVNDGVGGFAVLQTSGAIQLISIQPNGSVDSGDVIRTHFAYPV